MKPNQNYEEAASSKSKNNKVATQKTIKNTALLEQEEKKEVAALENFPWNLVTKRASLTTKQLNNNPHTIQNVNRKERSDIQFAPVLQIVQV